MIRQSIRKLPYVEVTRTKVMVTQVMLEKVQKEILFLITIRQYHLQQRRHLKSWVMNVHEQFGEVSCLTSGQKSKTTSMNKALILANCVLVSKTNLLTLYSCTSVTSLVSSRITIFLIQSSPLSHGSLKEILKQLNLVYFKIFRDSKQTVVLVFI